MNGFCPTCGAEWHGTPFCTSCGRRILPPEEPATEFPASPATPPPLSPSPGLPFSSSVSPAPELAPLGARFFALGIDSALVAALGWLLAMVAVGAYRAGAGFLPEGAHVTRCWWQGVTLVLAFAWHTAFLAQGGQTPGKRLLGIRVTGADGGKLGGGQAFLRACGYIPSALFLGLGFLWALWDPRRQTWHDKAARTVVVLAE